MSKEIRVVAWCDGDHDDEDVPAEVERTITLDGSRATVIDLCQVCDKVFVDVLTLMERGVAADKTAPTSTKRKRTMRRMQPLAEADEGLSPDGFTLAERTCPEKGCGLVAPTRPLLNSHVRKIHGKGFRDYPGFKRETRTRTRNAS